MGHTQDPDRFAEFQRATRAMQQTGSPYAIRVHEVGQTHDGLPWMVMDLLEGQDLASLLHERGPLPTPDALRWIGQACEALKEAHSIGITHGGLHPRNLF